MNITDQVEQADILRASDSNGRWGSILAGRFFERQMSKKRFSWRFIKRGFYVDDIDATIKLNSFDANNEIKVPEDVEKSAIVSVDYQELQNMLNIK